MASEVNSRPTGSIRLAGRDGFRVRVGDYRIVDAVDDAIGTDHANLRVRVMESLAN